MAPHNSRDLCVGRHSKDGLIFSVSNSVRLMSTGIWGRAVGEYWDMVASGMFDHSYKEVLQRSAISAGPPLSPHMYDIASLHLLCQHPIITPLSTFKPSSRVASLLSSFMFYMAHFCLLITAIYILRIFMIDMTVNTFLKPGIFLKSSLTVFEMSRMLFYTN